jgi:hypothetical protein
MNQELSKNLAVKVGNIKVLERRYPVPTIEVYNGSDLWFSTNNAETLGNLTKAIQQFFELVKKKYSQQEKG